MTFMAIVRLYLHAYLLIATFNNVYLVPIFIYISMTYKIMTLPLPTLISVSGIPFLKCA